MKLGQLNPRAGNNDQQDYMTNTFAYCRQFEEKRWARYIIGNLAATCYNVHVHLVFQVLKCRTYSYPTLLGNGVLSFLKEKDGVISLHELVPHQPKPPLPTTPHPTLSPRPIHTIPFPMQSTDDGSGAISWFPLALIVATGKEIFI